MYNVPRPTSRRSYCLPVWNCFMHIHIYCKGFETFFFIVQMLRGRIVQINDKSMKIGKQGNFCTLISNRSGPTLDFAQEGCNLQYKMADIENVNFSDIF